MVQQRSVELVLHVLKIFPGQVSTAHRRADFSSSPPNLVRGQGSTAHGGADYAGAPQDLVPGQGSTTFGGARHHVQNFVGVLPGFRSEQGSAALGGADHHGQSLVPAQGSTAHRGADPAGRVASDFRPRRVCKRFLESRWGGRECACGQGCTFAHSRAELHPEASAHEHDLAAYFDA